MMGRLNHDQGQLFYSFSLDVKRTYRDRHGGGDVLPYLRRGGGGG